tara:strand:- start:3112 stop:3468 length:357 start_codon:yes stop_codon:yes gene_type:complete
MEYSPNRTHYVAGSATGVTINGRVSLCGIIAAPTRNSVSTSDPFINGSIEFKDGGSGGDVRYKLTVTGIDSTFNKCDQGTICIEIPGSGILFENGLYYVPTAAVVGHLTIVYQGGDAE